MAKKNYTIRLYRTHDHDLITFMATHQFNIVKGVYCALTAFSKGQIFVIKIPPAREGGNLEINRVYARMLTLDTEVDAEAIEILEKLKDGSKNNFLKNLLRLYLCCPISEASLIDEHDMDFFYKKFTIFKQGKKEIEAGKLNSSKIKKNKKKKIDISDENTEGETSTKNVIIEEELQKEKVIIDEPDYETAIEDIELNSDSEDEESDEITSLFSSILN